MKRALLSERTQAVILCAAEQARGMGHGYVGTEHLLLALLHQGCRILRREGWEETMLHTLLLLQKGAGDRLPPVQGLSPQARQLLAQARKDAKALHARCIEPEHLLLAMSREETCTASAILTENGADLNCIFSEVYQDLQRPIRAQANGRMNETRLLELYCDNMLEKAEHSDPVIGREREIEMLIRILCRKGKNNPALIGEPGVGKTAIVEGLAQRMQQGSVPELLREKRLLSLNMASVLAGTKYRGEFEERVRDMLAEVRRCGNIILFVDEMHTIVGAGSAEGAIDAANLLKPSLGRGELQMIGATTPEEYRKYVEKDAALERRFRPVSVCEPSREETERMLLGLRPGLEAHHGIRISDEAIHASVELSCRYLTDRFLPDKALDLLDESAAGLRLRQFGSVRVLDTKRQQLTQELEQAVRQSRFEQAAVLRDKLQQTLRRQSGAFHRSSALQAEDVAQTVSERTGIPAAKLDVSERERLLSLREALLSHVVGQDAAVTSTARAILRGRTGLADGKRPAASLLFIGPSGVGKTELCKALAQCVYGSEEALVRLDMTEYAEPSSVTRLIGAPPGYVGHEQGGTLTEKVRRRPYCVVLFDELEKAHREVTGLLLQILEDGILTDCVGRTVDFRNATIVMTSNAGSGGAKSGVGFTPGSDAEYAKRRLSDCFSPELLGRIDCIAPFAPLSRGDLERIAQKQLKEAAERSKKQDLTLQILPQAAERLAMECCREDSGARSLRHRIQTAVEEPAAEYLLRGHTPMTLTVGADENGVFVRP